MTPVVLHEKRDVAFWITLNRPDKRNALNDEVLKAIAAGYRAAHEDPQVRVIVLTGAGEKAFCAGGDLAADQDIFAATQGPTLAYADLMRQARRATIPTIARINGACMAGGMGLLGMADLAVAAEHARFGLPEVRIGLFPMQVIALLQPLVPARTLKQWCLTGEPFSAAQAQAAGLLTAVVPAPELDAAVERLVASLSVGSPMAMQRGLHALNCMADMAFNDAIAFGEAQICLMPPTADAREGFAAFNEKRSPRWSGR